MFNRTVTVTVPEEWEKDLDSLKKDEFYDKTRADMLRYLIKLGLEESKKDKDLDAENS